MRWVARLFVGIVIRPYARLKSRIADEMRTDAEWDRVYGWYYDRGWLNRGKYEQDRAAGREAVRPPRPPGAGDPMSWPRDLSCYRGPMTPDRLSSLGG